MSVAARYQIRHQTVYAYAGDVAHAHHMLHLTPPATPTQRCSDYVLELWPRPALCRRHADAFGNMVTSLEIDRPHSRLEVTARMQVELLERPARVAADSLPWEQVAASLRYSPAPVESERLHAMRYRTQSPFVPLKRVLVQFALESDRPVESLGQRVRRRARQNRNSDQAGSYNADAEEQERQLTCERA